MDRVEFEVLRSYAEQQELSLITGFYGFSEEEIDHTRQKLQNAALLDGDIISQAGLDALAPYKVKRAVFLAAGFGSRMVPVTINTPKPLVRVHGRRIIDTLIDAVLEAGIEEIWIVRGYLGEQFELLQKKYPMIKLIDNPEFDGTGTISSFYYARHLLKGAYVLESDLVVSNPGIIHKYHYTSNFMGTKMNETDDWYLKTDSNGVICEIGVGGSGASLYKLIGISFWNAEDGEKLAADVQEAYWKPEGKKLPMSYIPFRIYRDRYRVSIMPCRKGDVVEIDSFSELQEFDETYKTN